MITDNGTMEVVNVRIRLDRGRRNAVGSRYLWLFGQHKPFKIELSHLSKG